MMIASIPQTVSLMAFLMLMLMHDTSGKPQWRMFLNMGQMRGRGASDMGTSLVQSDPGTCANAIEARERVEQERDSVRQELLKSREEIERLHNDMQRYNSTCSNKIKQLEESYQQLQTTRSAEVDLVAKEHERQLGLLKKQLQQEMALNSALTRKVEDRDATIANWREDKQREIVSATDKATKELNRNIEELEHASSRARELLMEKIEYLERLVKEHVEQAESLRKLLQQEMDRTSALTKEITDVKAHDKLQLDEVKEQLVTSLEEIDRLMNELTRKNSSLSTETKQLQDDYEKLKKERDSDVQRVVNERTHQIESLKNQLRQELDRTSALSKAIAEKEATITKWNVDKQKDIEVAKENAVKQISQDLEEMHRMKERTRKLLVDKIENLEFVIGTLREDHAKDVAAVRNEVDIEKQAAKREYENAFAAKFAEFRKQVEEQNRAHVAELKLALVRAQKEQDALKQGQAQQMSALRYAQEHQKQAMEQKHNETVAALELEAIKTRRRFADAIKAKDAELVESLDRLRHEMDNEIAVRQSRHALEVKDLMDSVRCLKGDNKELDMKISLLQQNYSDAIKENERWLELYRTRSYCNFTHIQEDTTAAVASATRITLSKLSVAGRATVDHLCNANEVAKETLNAASKIALHQFAQLCDVATERTLVASEVAARNMMVAGETASRGMGVIVEKSEPYVQRGRILYNKYLKDHVDRHFVPVFEKHVKPGLEAASGYLLAVTLKIQSMYNLRRKQLIKSFRERCPSLKGRVKEAALPALVTTFVSKNCKEPEETVDRFLLFLLISFALVFRGFLARTLLFVICLPFKVLWLLSPMRLVFRGKGEELNEPDPSQRSETSQKNSEVENQSPPSARRKK